MSNVIRFDRVRRSQETVREEASLWLARIDAGLAPEQRAQLEAWLDEDPRHAEVLMEMAALWDQLCILSGLSEMFPLERYQPRRARATRRRILVGGAAAATLAVLGVPAGLRLLDAWRGAGAVPAQIYETAVGEQSTINLPDNSVIVLNTDTHVEVRYGAAERQIVLRHGEALFTVQGDPQRPFRVYAGARMVEAVGTAFTVQHDTGSDAVAVMVTAGKVSFRSDTGSPPAAAPATGRAAGNPLFLEAGDYLYSAGRQSGAASRKVTMAPEEVEMRLAWSTGMLIFRDEPLSRLLDEVQRYTPIRLRADPAILDMRVSAVYRPGDVENLLSGLRDNLNIDSVRVGNDLILLRGRL